VDRNSRITPEESPQEDQERLFDAKLKKYLTHQQLVAFRIASSELLAGKMLASMYYDALTRQFFPRHQEFEDVFPLLLDTIPHDGKREALEQIHRIQNSPEALHARRAKEEEDELLLQRRSAEMALAKSSKKNAPASPWTSSKKALRGPPSSTIPEPAVPKAARANWSMNPVSPVHADPEDFPELPTSGGTKKFSSKTPAKSNVWFSRHRR
jgi:hypothetical protein